MSPEAQRIAIAEACGYVRDPHSQMGGWLDNKAGFPCSIPDYLNDLNAMHEAEKTLTFLDQYCDHLERPLQYPQQAHFATARQRAEAFLKTLGLWKP